MTLTATRNLTMITKTENVLRTQARRVVDRGGEDNEVGEKKFRLCLSANEIAETRNSNDAASSISEALEDEAAHTAMNSTVRAR